LEEHPLLRGGMTDFLNAQPDLQVCGEADNIRDARNEITECKPQLLCVSWVNKSFLPTKHTRETKGFDNFVSRFSASIRVCHAVAPRLRAKGGHSRATSLRHSG
jgi:DNA-binding NarL/FixJ family response regulator